MIRDNVDLCNQTRNPYLLDKLCQLSSNGTENSTYFCRFFWSKAG